MRPSGIIYQSKKSASSGERQIQLNLGKRIIYHLARGFGAGLIAFAIVGIVFSFWPIVKEEFLYQAGHKEEAALSGFGQLLSKSEASSLGLDPYFSVYIPKIGAKAKIVPNVDAGKPREYLQALGEGVAHARGTNFPGRGETIYLFSHSTDSPLNYARYNAVFYLLRKLEKGDRVVVYFLSDRYEYVITDKTITSAGDTSWLKDDGKGERLVLQTCDPPGTTWRRLLIIAVPVR